MASIVPTEAHIQPKSPSDNFKKTIPDELDWMLFNTSQQKYTKINHIWGVQSFASFPQAHETLLKFCIIKYENLIVKQYELQQN